MADRFLRRVGRRLCKCGRRLAKGCGPSEPCPWYYKATLCPSTSNCPHPVVFVCKDGPCATPGTVFSGGFGSCYKVTGETFAVCLFPPGGGPTAPHGQLPPGVPPGTQCLPQDAVILQPLACRTGCDDPACVPCVGYCWMKNCNCGTGGGGPGLAVSLETLSQLYAQGIRCPGALSPTSGRCMIPDLSNFFVNLPPGVIELIAADFFEGGCCACCDDCQRTEMIYERAEFNECTQQSSVVTGPRRPLCCGPGKSATVLVDATVDYILSSQNAVRKDRRFVSGTVPGQVSYILKSQFFINGIPDPPIYDLSGSVNIPSMIGCGPTAGFAAAYQAIEQQIGSIPTSILFDPNLQQGQNHSVQVFAGLRYENFTVWCGTPSPSINVVGSVLLRGRMTPAPGHCEEGCGEYPHDSLAGGGRPALPCPGCGGSVALGEIVG